MTDNLKIIFRAALNLAVFLVIIGLGWGLDDLAGFFANPVRVAVIVVFVAQGAYNLYQGLTDKRPAFHRLEHIGLYRLQLMATETAFVLAPYTDRRGLGLMADSVRWWGLAVMVFGFALVIWAFQTWPDRLVPVDTVNELSPEHAISAYGSLSEQLRADGEEFRCGPFRWLRYPHLLGRIILVAGFSLAFSAWVGLVIAGLMLIVVMVRVYQMDEIYQQYFGPAWVQYSGRTRRLLPFLY